MIKERILTDPLESDILKRKGILCYQCKKRIEQNTMIAIRNVPHSHAKYYHAHCWQKLSQ